MDFCHCHDFKFAWKKSVYFNRIFYIPSLRTYTQSSHEPHLRYESYDRRIFVPKKSSLPVRYWFSNVGTRALLLLRLSLLELNATWIDILRISVELSQNYIENLCSHRCPRFSCLWKCNVTLHKSRSNSCYRSHWIINNRIGLQL